ncbi:OmpW family outer membrane protein [Limnohabitans sp. Rim8]|uniref:OmpW/AlkL family protein n=1 Tax=Limnohabitans sp. Rim8 TaxID=1100718 RepID=UPI0026364CBF|nr:OmpW family outer membrane protein [Limnohabitans sp. Rim8]
MNKQTGWVALLLAGSVSGVMAQSLSESPWQIRLRSVHLDSVNKDTTSLGLSIDNKSFATIDFSYFFNKNMAAELSLTMDQKQRVYANGTDIGSFKHLPPTLLLQYHFTDFDGFKPYVGGGIAYTHFSSVSLPPGLSLDSHNWGTAFQVGVDFPIDKNWSINLDVKKAYIRTDVYADGSSLGRLRVDPLLYGVGIGYRY